MMSGGMFDDDPFFAAHREQMRQMNEMFRDPFGFPSPGMLSIGGPSQMRQQQLQVHSRQQPQQQQLAPMGLFNFGFGSMFHGFQDMRRMLNDMHSTLGASGGMSSPNGQMFSQSSFVSFSNGPGGQPKVYQASSSTTQGPGGVRETRKTVRDSESGVEKVAVGRHIGSRSHVIERQRNRRTGSEEQNQEFINLDEEEAPEFDREWQEKRRQGSGHARVDYRHRQDRAHRRQLALPAPSQRHSHHRNPSYRDRE